MNRPPKHINQAAMAQHLLRRAHIDQLLDNQKILKFLLDMPDSEMAEAIKFCGYSFRPERKHLTDALLMVENEIARRVDGMSIDSLLLEINKAKAMKYEQAHAIAKDVELKLKPYCERIGIAGSIRRMKPEVKDIEIVCIPKRTEQKNLLDEVVATPPVSGFIHRVNNWPRLRGDATGKYTQRQLDGIRLDIIIADEDNWGYIAALRTGSADWFQRVMLPAAKNAGYRLDGGYIWYGQEKLSIRNEKDLFILFNVDYVKPQDRN